MSWKTCESKVQRALSEELYTDNIDTERACRVKACSNENKKKKKVRPRTVICELPIFVDEARILKKSHPLKGTSYCLNEGFNKETFCYRKDLWKKIEALRREGKVDFLNYKSILW